MKIKSLNSLRLNKIKIAELKNKNIIKGGTGFITSLNAPCEEGKSNNGDCHDSILNSNCLC